MRAKILGVILLVLFISVIKGCSTKVCGCLQFDTQVQLNFVDQSENSLLNPDHPQAITEHDIDLLFVENGQEIPANSHFGIVNNESANQHYLQLEPILESEDSIPVGYLDISGFGRDTVKVKIADDNDLVRVTKVWYNDELRWDRYEDRDQNPGRYIEITKELK